MTKAGSPKGALQLALGIPGGPTPMPVGRRARRAQGDYWQTPLWLVLALVERLNWASFPRLIRVLDPGAGDGRLAACFEAEAARRGHECQITAVERDAARTVNYPHHWISVCADWWEWAPQQLARWDLVLCNPPFAVDRDVIWCRWADWTLRLVGPAGTLAQLGHALLWTTEERSDWWGMPGHLPTRWLASARRPSFSGDGKTDGRFWGWFVWTKGAPPGCEFVLIPFRS